MQVRAAAALAPPRKSSESSAGRPAAAAGTAARPPARHTAAVRGCGKRRERGESSKGRRRSSRRRGKDRREAHHALRRLRGVLVAGAAAGAGGDAAGAGRRRRGGGRHAAPLGRGRAARARLRPAAASGLTRAKRPRARHGVAACKRAVQHSSCGNLAGTEAFQCSHVWLVHASLLQRVDVGPSKFRSFLSQIPNLPPPFVSRVPSSFSQFSCSLSFALRRFSRFFGAVLSSRWRPPQSAARLRPPPTVTTGSAGRDGGRPMPARRGSVPPGNARRSATVAHNPQPARRAAVARSVTVTLHAFAAAWRAVQ